jgi:site-specific DNA-methyltransferase (adenine-specific)
VDHPTQLPPALLKRLIEAFTYKNEIVLDCFNGSGTTTLVADMMNRKYLGIEKSTEYHLLATERHKEVLKGIDPFRKVDRDISSKNSPVPRLKKQKYIVNKKTLQLDVKRIANILGKLPNREDVKKHSIFPINYFDDYFFSWGEVCAAARNTGMNENMDSLKNETEEQSELFVYGNYPLFKK